MKALSCLPYLAEHLRGQCLLLMVTALLLAVSPATWAAEPLVFDSPEQEEQFDRLTEELRCLVCQNQSLADSDAQLAQDLRREVLDLIREGKDDEAVKSFLVTRYGDFVLYRPPVKGNTLLLWVMPMLLLAGGALFVGINIKRRRDLLDDEEGLPGSDLDNSADRPVNGTPDP